MSKETDIRARIAREKKEELKKVIKHLQTEGVDINISTVISEAIEKFIKEYSSSKNKLISELGGKRKTIKFTTSETIFNTFNELRGGVEMGVYFSKVIIAIKNNEIQVTSENINDLMRLQNEIFFTNQVLKEIVLGGGELNTEESIPSLIQKIDEIDTTIDRFFGEVKYER